MGRKPVEKSRKKDTTKIFSWAATLFPHLQQEGVKTLTMDRAASILNKSKSTLYEYLSSKEEILELIVQYKINQLREFQKYLKNEELNYPERLVKAIEFFCLNITGVSNLFLEELNTYYPEQWKKIDRFIDECVEQINEYYLEGAKRGYFRNVDSNLLSMLDEQFFRMITNTNMLKKYNLHFETALKGYLKIKLYGLLA